MIGYDPDNRFPKIGDTTQVFLDNEMITCVKNIKRSFHKAIPHDANPLVVKDRSWEEMPYFTTSYAIIRDDDGLFKLWYPISSSLLPASDRRHSTIPLPGRRDSATLFRRMASISRNRRSARLRSAATTAMSCAGKQIWMSGFSIR